MTQSHEKATPGERMALVARLGGTMLAIPIACVEEVLPALPIEPIPQAPPWLLGVVFVRGHWIPVWDVAQRLGCRDRVRPVEPPIVCLSLRGKHVGVEVDEALDLIDWSQGVFAPANELGAHDGLFAGLVEFGGQVLHLLNPEQFDPGQADHLLASQHHGRE